MSTALALLLALTPARAADAGDVPAATEAKIVVRALAYDRALAARAGADLVIGVIAASPADRARADDVRAGFGALAGMTVAGVPLAVAPLASASEDAARAAGVDVLYVAGRGDPDAALALAAALGVPLVADDAGPVRAGKAAFAVVSEEGKPRILFHLSTAQADGMNPEPGLLALAEVIR